MTACPKCGEDGLVWVKGVRTKDHPYEPEKKKDSTYNWLKRDLGEGQVSSEWHTCGKGGELGTQIEVIHKIRPFCNDCIGKLILCDNSSCKLCYYNKSYCAKCDVHPNIVNMK